MLTINLNHQRKKFLHVILLVPFLGRIAEKRGIQQPCCLKGRDLCDNSLFLEALIYYRKGLHLRYERSPRSSCEMPFNNSIYLIQKKSFKKTYEKGIKNSICFLLV